MTNVIKRYNKINKMIDTNTIMNSKSKVKSLILSMFTLAIIVCNVGDALAQCPLICNKNVNISMDDDCRVEITPAHLLEGVPALTCVYTVVVMGSNGQPLSTSPFVTSAHVGMTLDVKITYDHNSCWGRIKVEDKKIPTIICPDPITINCYDTRTFEKPTAVDNCGGIKRIDIISDELEDLGCSAAFSAIRRITYVAYDLSDNKSATCTRIINYRKVPIDSVAWPRSRDNVDLQALECDNKENWDKNGNMFPDIAETGVPTTKAGIPILPNLSYCELNVTFKDIELPKCGKSKKYMRTWSIMDWCTSRITSRTQVIVIEDTEAPEATINLNNIKIPSTKTNCLADWNVVPPTNFIDCSESSYSVAYALPDPFGGFSGDPFYTAANVIRNSNGTFTIVNLPFGKVSIRYKLEDVCGNFRYKFGEIEVIDRLGPDVICDDFTVITLGTSGIADLSAISLDNGSKDHCSDVDFHALRMNLGCDSIKTWEKSVRFCCEDVGKDVMVALRVTDKSGNSNSCMVTVRIQDKNFPKITCPRDITLLCGSNLENFDLTGKPVATDNCANPIVTKKDSLATNNCGVGMIFRKWYASDKNNNRDSCTQKITITPLPGITANDSIWRSVKDTTIEGCVSYEVNPSMTGEPKLPSGNCRQIVGNYTDQKFTGVDGACAKIVRTWTVIDWCDYSPNNPDRGKYTYKQVIKINNTKGPTFKSCRDTTFCLQSDSCRGPITYKESASDICTPDDKLVWSYQIDLDNNGSIDHFGSTNDASRVYRPGRHKIIWTVRDGCGNASTCTKLLIIKDCKKPTPYCVGDLTTVVMPGAGFVDIWPIDFNLGSTDNCGGKLRFTFSADLNDTVRKFTCSQLGTHNLQMWVTDTSGNQDFCSVKMNIQDNNNSCNKSGSLVANGKITNEDNKGVKNIDIVLTNLTTRINSKLLSNDKGEFAFTSFPNSMYQVKPSNVNDQLLGVNTIDLVHIQRHLLGISRLSGYKLIAADVDNDQRVALNDIVALRKLILGVDEKFEQPESAWKFIPTDYAIQNMNNPWPHDNVVNVTLRNGTIDKPANFMAIKTGDIDGSAFSVSTRSGKNHLLTVDQVNTLGGEMKLIVENGVDPISATALQLKIKMPSSVYGVSKINSTLDIKENEFYFDKKSSELKISISRSQEFSINPKAKLFEIETMSFTSGDQLIYTQVDPYSFIANDEDIKAVTITSRSKFGFEVTQNEPNPFKENTAIDVIIPKSGSVSVRIFSLDGKMVYSNKLAMQQGVNKLVLNESDLMQKHGVMIYEIEYEGNKIVKKMVVTK
jgi:hypothetical protein